jgi:hypothetical protein
MAQSNPAWSPGLNPPSNRTREALHRRRSNTYSNRFRVSVHHVQFATLWCGIVCMPSPGLGTYLGGNTLYATVPGGSWLRRRSSSVSPARRTLTGWRSTPATAWVGVAASLAVCTPTGRGNNQLDGDCLVEPVGWGCRPRRGCGAGARGASRARFRRVRPNRRSSSNAFGAPAVRASITAARSRFPASPIGVANGGVAPFTSAETRPDRPRIPGDVGRLAGRPRSPA